MNLCAFSYVCPEYHGKFHSLCLTDIRIFAARYNAMPLVPSTICWSYNKCFTAFSPDHLIGIDVGSTALPAEIFIDIIIHVLVRSISITGNEMRSKI